MRDRIFSSVLLPAPLRPMMPTTSPALRLERDVAQRPERFGVWLDAAGPRDFDALDERSRRRLCDRVAQRPVAGLRVSPMRYCLPRPFDLQCQFAHARVYTISANVFSIRLK